MASRDIPHKFDNGTNHSQVATRYRRGLITERWTPIYAGADPGINLWGDTHYILWIHPYIFWIVGGTFIYFQKFNSEKRKILFYGGHVSPVPGAPY